MIPVLFVVGGSGSGKTTLVEAVVSLLCKSDLKVGYVKHGPHGFCFDHEGKDTWRVAAAGALAVAIEHDGRTGLVLTSTSRCGPLALVDDLFPRDLDLVLVEGYKSVAGDKIEVFRLGVGETPCCSPEDGVIAYVTDLAIAPAAAHHLPLDRPDRVADFIRTWLHRQKSCAPPAATITVNGIPLVLNEYVARTLAAVTHALVADLRGANVDGAITVSVSGTHGASIAVAPDGRPLPMNPFVADLIGGTLRGCVERLTEGPSQGVAFEIALPPRTSSFCR